MRSIWTKVPPGVKWLLGAVGAAVIAVPVTAWLSGSTVPHKGFVRFLRSDVPLWLVLILVLILIALAVWLLIPSRRSSTAAALELNAIRNQHAEARQVIRSLDVERTQLAARVSRDSIYARALLDVFAHLDTILTGGLVDSSRAIEKSILEPMCGVFSEQKGATVKMAVLEVSTSEPFEYTMSAHVNWGAEAANFKWSKAEPLENLGFETREAVAASAVRLDGRADALLIVMAPTAFAPEDHEYIALIATAVGFARAATRRNS